jgi:hypothetical protein
MVRDGFTVLGFDGPSPYGGAWNPLPPPPTIGGFRPDVFAEHLYEPWLALGEAKTAADLANYHTLAQLRAFSLFCNTSSRHSLLYVGVPRSAAPELDRILRRAGAPGNSIIRRIHIPDCLLEQDVNHVA